MSSSFSKEAEPVWQGKHLAVHDAEGWEYVTRTRGRGVVGVIAVTEAGELILVEQHRPPTGGPVIELPAGLVGDEGEETLEEAAERELLEETGYHAKQFERICTGYSSAGLTNERVTLLRAIRVTRQGEGGGVGGERISIHLVPIREIAAWLLQQQQQGVGVDLKIFIAASFLTG